MNFNDLSEEQQESYQEAYSIGYDDGWHEGYEAYENTGGSQNDHYDDGYHAGFIAGTEAEQKRIQDVLGMMFESALNMGQGNKAVQYKHAMDLLKPVTINYDLVDED